MKYTTLALCTAAAAAVGTHMATSQTAVTDPAQFTQKAASSDMFEIQSSELALEMSKDEAVRAFAEHMIEDHTEASQMLVSAAGIDGVAPPAAMMDKHRVELEQLRAAGEDGFDAAYIAAQTIGHEEAVALFESFSTQGEEGALRNFATETLPVLQEHLEEVQALQET